jgi:hypothetical protein
VTFLDFLFVFFYCFYRAADRAQLRRIGLQALFWGCDPLTAPPRERDRRALAKRLIGL